MGKKKKDTTSVNNRENGGNRANKVNPSCPGPGCPGKAEPGPEPGSHQLAACIPRRLTRLSLPPPALPHTRGSRAPGVCLEEGKWEEKKQVYLAPWDSVTSPLPLYLPDPRSRATQSPLPFPASFHQDYSADSSPFPNLPLFFSTVRWRHGGGRIYLGQRPQLAQEPRGTQEF